MVDSGDDEDYETPLQYKKPFGAGLKRKRINFVPQASESSLVAPTSSEPTKSAHEAYLSIVFPKPLSDESKQDTEADQQAEEANENDTQEGATEPHARPPICAICKLPTSAGAATNEAAPHEASIVHQICLEHSYPPSSIDRQRKGLAYLQSYGWDPDARKGLGATGNGRLYPIRADQKDDNRGIGATKENLKEDSKKVSPSHKDRKEAKDKAKKRESRMRDLFYSRDEVNKYLGVEL